MCQTERFFPIPSLLFLRPAPCRAPCPGARLDRSPPLFTPGLFFSPLFLSVFPRHSTKSCDGGCVGGERISHIRHTGCLSPPVPHPPRATECAEGGGGACRGIRQGETPSAAIRERGGGSSGRGRGSWEKENLSAPLGDSFARRGVNFAYFSLFFFSLFTGRDAGTPLLARRKRGRGFGAQGATRRRLALRVAKKKQKGDRTKKKQSEKGGGAGREQGNDTTRHHTTRTNVTTPPPAGNAPSRQRTHRHEEAQCPPPVTQISPGLSSPRPSSHTTDGRRRGERSREGEEGGGGAGVVVVVFIGTGREEAKSQTRRPPHLRLRSFGATRPQAPNARTPNRGDRRTPPSFGAHLAVAWGTGGRAQASRPALARARARERERERDLGVTCGSPGGTIDGLEALPFLPAPPPPTLPDLT